MPDTRRAEKLLFVCSRNRIRSLTAERLMSGVAGYEVRSAGTRPDARIVLTEGHLGWADTVFVMEKSHLNRIRLKYPEAASETRFVVLHIPDDYQYLQPELLEELRARLGPHVVLPEETGDG